MDVRNAIRALEDKLERQRKAVVDTEEHIEALTRLQSGQIPLLAGKGPAPAAGK